MVFPDFRLNIVFSQDSLFLDTIHLRDGSINTRITQRVQGVLEMVLPQS